MKECICLRGAADTSFTLVCPERHGDMIIVLYFVIGSGIYCSKLHFHSCLPDERGYNPTPYLAFSAVTTEPQSDPGHIIFKQMRPGTDLVLHPLRVYSSPLHQLSISSVPVSAPVSPGTA